MGLAPASPSQEKKRRTTATSADSPTEIRRCFRNQLLRPVANLPTCYSLGRHSSTTVLSLTGPMHREETTLSQSHVFVARKRRVQTHHPLRILQNHGRKTASLPMRRVRTDVLDDKGHPLLPPRGDRRAIRDPSGSLDRARRERGVATLNAESGCLGRATRTVVQALTRHVRRLPAGLMATLTWDRGLELAAHRTFSIATGVQVLLLRPVQSVATRHQREHEWSAAPVSAEGDRPRRLHPDTVGRDCPRAQHAASQDTGLSHTGGYTRGDCCIDRLNRHDKAGPRGTRGKKTIASAGFVLAVLSD